MTALKKQITAFLFLFSAMNYNVNAQLDVSGLSNIGSSITCTSPTDIWHSGTNLGNTYHLDALKLGSDGWGQITVGGAAPGLPIMWGNIYPSNYTDGVSTFYPAKFYGNSDVPSVQLIYEPWTSRMSFQFSTNHATTNAGDNVEWKNVINFDAGGNVAIGDVFSNSCYKLTVNGNIGCTALKVTTPTNWCDYVFDKNYKLMPINNLEQYISINKHLPDIPTEAEVKKDGLDVAETIAMLLKKIEEMSLYIIEINKKVNGLENEVKDLKAKSGN